MIKILRSLFSVVFRPFAGPQQVNGSDGAYGDGDPGTWWGTEG